MRQASGRIQFSVATTPTVKQALTDLARQRDRSLSWLGGRLLEALAAHPLDAELLLAADPLRPPTNSAEPGLAPQARP